MERILNECLKIERFKYLFGCRNQSDISVLRDVLKNYDDYDFSYRPTTHEEERAIILDICNCLMSDTLPRAGKKRYCDWESGWKETLDLFIQSDFDIKSLIPQYYHDFSPARIEDSYIIPSQKDFIFQYFSVFRKWILYTYLLPFDHIYEFGCGTALNLLTLAEKFPQKKYYGFDWAISSIKIIDMIRKKLGLNIEAKKVNLLEPINDIDFKNNSGVFTFSSLEQVARNTDNFINLMLDKKPNMVVNIEPINEFYSKNNLLDYLALNYHKKRNYLWNYYTQLRELERKGHLRIVNFHHHKVGNIYNTAASYIVWNPL